MAGKPVARSKRLADMRAAALRLMAQHGFHGFSMRDIARLTQQSHANVYKLVADKETLVFLALRRRLEAARASIEATLTVRSARGPLRAWMTDQVRRLHQAPAEAALWRGDALPLHAAQVRQLEALRTECEAMLCALVDGVLGKKGGRRATSLRRVRLLLGLAERAAKELPATGAPRPDRVAKEALAVFLDGALRAYR